MEINYKVVYSKRRTLAISIGDDLTVTVRAPLRTGKKVIEQAVEQNRAWIISALKKAEERRARYPEPNEAELRELYCRAKEYLPARVEYFSRLTGLKPTAVKINNAKKRFGSCSDKNSINFSCRLMRYPPEAIDYVVLHELCHIAEHNHSSAFYALIEKYMPDYKKAAKLLK